MRSSRLVPLLAIIVVVSACAPRVMNPTMTALQPTTEKAVVRFLFPRTGGEIWDGETFIGVGLPSAQFDYYASPGQHLFYTGSANHAFLEADLDGGKTYYIIGRVWGIGKVWVGTVGNEGFGLVAVNRGGEHWDKVNEWEQSLTRYEPNPEVLQALEGAVEYFVARSETESGDSQHTISKRTHKDWMRANLAAYESTWKHKYSWPKLNREDGR
jgi:hypothetical protein